MRALVDVDGTLWSLYDVLLPILHEKYGVPLELPTEWDFYKTYMTDSQFYKCVDEAHDEQWYSEPFVGAPELFGLLKNYNVEAIVASHRNPRFNSDLAEWLARHYMQPVSGIYTGYDKRFLIRECQIVIDDSPSTIAYVQSLGIRSLAIRWPWNAETTAVLFGDLPEMNRWLEAEL